jgi:hypothetical protein
MVYYGKRYRGQMGSYQHHLFWKDLSDKSKGGFWAYIHSDHVAAHGIPGYGDIANSPAFVNGRYVARIPKNCRSKGRKWTFGMDDDSRFSCRIQVSASYSSIKAWAQTWTKKPTSIQGESKTKPSGWDKPESQWDERHKVYFVKLLSFDATIEGKLYYKIGKAKNVPKRINQFGPCSIIDTLNFAHPREASEIERKLHSLMDSNRVKATEIFLLSEGEAEKVIELFSSIRGS